MEAEKGGSCPAVILMGDSGPIVVAEVAQAHDGSLGAAHAFIDAVADAGADAIKFQTHIAAAESTPDEPWRVKFSLQDATRFDYWKRMEFSASSMARGSTIVASLELVPARGELSGSGSCGRWHRERLIGRCSSASHEPAPAPLSGLSGGLTTKQPNS